MCKFIEQALHEHIIMQDARVVKSEIFQGVQPLFGIKTYDFRGNYALNSGNLMDIGTPLGQGTICEFHAIHSYFINLHSPFLVAVSVVKFPTS